jgi:hypothetical protein
LRSNDAGRKIGAGERAVARLLAPQNVLQSIGERASERHTPAILDRGARIPLRSPRVLLHPARAVLGQCLSYVLMDPEPACKWFFAANPIEVLVAETGRGRGVLGAVDGSPPLGVETDADERDRKSFLRRIGYKL